MKKFSFTLQKILGLREFEEKEAQIELARAISAADAIQAELNNIADQRIKQSYSRSQSSDIFTLQSIEYYIQRLDLRTEELLEDLARAQIVIEEKRSIMAEKMKNRKVLTKLKDKKKEEHRYGVLLNEEEIMDDIANSNT
jgi:flagellar protein FliJ